MFNLLRVSHYDASYYTRDQAEYWWQQHGLLRPDELAALSYAWGRPFTYYDIQNQCMTQRHPGTVYSIGCGIGNLETALERMGCTVIGVDPSPGATQLYKGSTRVDNYDGGGDTILFVESIEHLTLDEINDIFPKIPTGAQVIIVNWYGMFPIHGSTDHWDHVTTIDDRFYDHLARHRTTLLRHDGHLVLGHRVLDYESYS